MELSTTSRSDNKPGSLIDNNQRLHGIDALRAIAMILGMLLHATIAYKEHSIPTWPHDDDFNHWTFDFLYNVIHSFRMPLFFLIAGYFSRLMYYKIGEHAFVKHRFKRIAIPFIFSVVFILPFTILPFSIYRYNSIFNGNWEMIVQHSLQDIFSWKGLAHLWFLYYLLIYYSAFLVILRVRKKLSLQGAYSPLSSFISLLCPGSFPGIAVLIVLTWVILMNSHGLYFHVDTGILPNVAYLCFYALFFLKGWLINKKPVTFTWIADKFAHFISLGIGLCVVLFYLDYHGYLHTGLSLVITKLAVAAQINLLVYGVIGFFLKYCHSENNVWRYISDASYWMYLIHLGIIAALQIYFMHTALPGFIRFLLVLVIPLIVTLATYHFFVRYTIFGTYLHGKRNK